MVNTQNFRCYFGLILLSTVSPISVNIALSLHHYSDGRAVCLSVCRNVWPQTRVIGVPVESLQRSCLTFGAVRAILATSGLRPGNMIFSTQNEVRISPVYFYMYHVRYQRTDNCREKCIKRNVAVFSTFLQNRLAM